MLQLRSTFAPRRTLAAAGLLVTAVACGGGGGDSGGVNPKTGTTNASVTVPATITVPANSGALSVQVVATYDRTSGAAGALGTQTVAVSAAGSQTLPFTLDLAPCLNDAARAGGTTATSCVVRVQLTLLTGTTAVDVQSVGPLTLTGGSKLTVSPGVNFAAVAAVRVAPANGAAPATGARVVLGTPLTLAATVLDANGATLTGRAVRWSSSVPTVATVDSLSGAVTPVAVGTTTITAAVAGQAGTLGVNVVAPPQAVSISAGTGAGSGTVISTPNGIACRIANGVASSTCTAPFASDSAVTLTARPDANNTFAGWDANVCKGGVTDSTCTLTPSAAVSVTAAFVAVRTTSTTLTVNTAGDSAGGLVVSTQTGATGTISCHRIGGQTLGATCSTQYTAGTQVTLTATPDALSTFVGWSGACTSSGPTCVVTLGTTEAVPVATFAPSPSAHGVSVAPAGTGLGSLTILTKIRSAPCDRAQANRADGGTCIAPWDPTQVPATGVEITATPAAGYRFDHWIGCPPSATTGTTANGGATCTVKPNGVYAIAADFER